VDNRVPPCALVAIWKVYTYRLDVGYCCVSSGFGNSRELPLRPRAPSKEVLFARVSHHKRDLDDGSLDNLLERRGERRGSYVSTENILSEVPLCGCVTALTNGSCCVKASNAVAIGHRQEKRFHELKFSFIKFDM